MPTPTSGGGVRTRPRPAPSPSPTPTVVDVPSWPGGWHHPGRPCCGVDPDEAADRLRREFFDSTADPTFPPTIVRTVERVAYLPGVLAAVVVFLALGTLVHGLMVVLRRRRRDLAVMPAVGFSGRQVLGSVGVQATTIALVGLVAGIPLGLEIGRTGWRLTATALGVAAPPALPWLGLVAIGLLTLLVVNLLALGPGWRAHRARLGPALRAE